MSNKQCSCQCSNPSEPIEKEVSFASEVEQFCKGIQIYHPEISKNCFQFTYLFYGEKVKFTILKEERHLDVSWCFEDSLSNAVEIVFYGNNSPVVEEERVLNKKFYSFYEFKKEINNLLSKSIEEMQNLLELKEKEISIYREICKVTCAKARLARNTKV